MGIREIWEDFLTTTCSVCGAKKKSMRSFCYGCYRRLPPAMRHALWQRFGEGYEEAFEGARERLLEVRAT